MFNQEIVIEKLFQLLISGERDSARTIVSEVIDSGVSPEDMGGNVTALGNGVCESARSRPAYSL